MKKLLLMGVLCFAPFPALAGQAENGIYERSQGTAAVLVRAQGGQEVRLGERRNLKILKTNILSMNNENARFYLTVTVPYDPMIGPSEYTLLVDGTAYRQVGSGASQKETSSLSFEVTGDDNAKKVAKYLGTSLPYRRHPGYELQVSFIPAKPEFETGEEVIVTLRITNVGTKAIAFMQGGRNRAARDNQYIFSARYQGKQVEDIGTSYHFGGMSVRRVLEPRELFEAEVSLNKWFLFKEAGVYEIHGSYYLDFQDTADDSWKTIWEDYASADFAVTIKGR